MKAIINIALFLVIVVLSFLLIGSIRGPIEFQSLLDERENAVVTHLENHRTCQKAYKNITGEFAKTYDTLQHVLINDSFEIVKIIGDADNVNSGEIKKSYSYVSAKDSLASYFNIKTEELSTFIQGLEIIPYSNGKKFKMSADTLSYQKIVVPVINVRTTYEEFMEGYTGDQFRRYDSNYDPSKVIGYGDLSKPTTSGSWD